MKPYIFAVFANDDQQSLNLKEEYKNLMRLKNQYVTTQELIVEPHAFTDLNRLANINPIREKVTIFHYAGHAGEGNIYLEDETASAKHLKNYLNRRRWTKNLMLVFLNGCDSFSLIDELFEVGVPAIIATHKELPNSKAIKASEFFYDQLTALKDSTLEDILYAFIIRFSNLTEVEHPEDGYRGFVRNRPKEAKELWGVYYNPDEQIANIGRQWIPFPLNPTNGRSSTNSAATSNNPKAAIIEDLNTGELESALEKLSSLAVGSYYENDVILLRARYAGVTRDINLGISNPQNSKITLNRITQSILSLLKKL